MPINVPYFQILSPEQANPLGYGMLQGAQMANSWMNTRNAATQNKILQAQLPYAGQMAQQDLVKAQLANALSQNTLNYAPQTSQAAINLTNAQTNAQNALPGYYGSEAQKNLADANLTNQQVKYLPLQASANADPLTKLLIGQDFARRMLGNSISNQSPITSNNGGMTIQPAAQPQQPNIAAQVAATGIPYALPSPQMPGNYPTLPGGLNQAQGAQVLSQLNNGQPTVSTPVNGSSPSMYDIMYKNTLAQMTKDPTMGSYRSGSGGTYTDPVTGQSYSTDTTPNTTLDQRTVASIARVKPLIESLSNNLAQFQSASGQSQLGIGRALNYLSPSLANSFAPGWAALPGQYAAGHQALRTAPEALLRAWGLPVTNESLERMEDAVEPVFGETKQQYQQRLTDTMTQLQQNADQSAGRLKAGTTVSNQSTSPANSNKSQTVRVQTPDGKTWDIPQSNLNAAIKRGAKQL
jgi:hypothetical protein